MTIQFSELAGEILVPTIAVETDLNSSRVGLPALNKKLLVVGYPTSGGSATVGVPYQATSTAQAIALWGIGSQVAIMVEAALRISPRLDIWGMSYAQGTGSSTGVITLATSATSAGLLTVHVAGRAYRVGVESGDAPTDVGTALAAKINAHPNFPCTAADNGSGVVTLTARNLGNESNTIRYRSEISAGIGMTSTDTGAVFSGGTASGDPTAALANIQNQRFHLIALNTFDSTTGGVLKTHIELVSSALEQKWGFGVQGVCGNSAAATGLATALDSYRMQVVWHQSSDQPCFELAAVFGAERCRVVDRKQSLNYHALPGITAQFDETAWPTLGEERVAIAGAVIPIRPLRGGGVQIVRNVLARVTSPAFRDAEPLEIGDYLDEDIIEQFKLKYSDAALKSASPAQQPGTLDPARAIALVAARMMLLEGLDYLQGTKKIIQGKLIVAEQNATDPTRIDIGFPFIPSHPLHVVAIKKSYSTPDFL